MSEHKKEDPTYFCFLLESGFRFRFDIESQGVTHSPNSVSVQELEEYRTAEAVMIAEVIERYGNSEQERPSEATSVDEAIREEWRAAQRRDWMYRLFGMWVADTQKDWIHRSGHYPDSPPVVKLVATQSTESDEAGREPEEHVLTMIQLLPVQDEPASPKP